MEFYDGVSRGLAFRRIGELINEVKQDSARDKGVSWGLQMALNILTELPAEGMWHDPGDEQYPIPEGVMLNLEITRGTLQTVERGWRSEGQWRKIGSLIPDNWVTGWMMLPQPRKEKQNA